MQNKEFVKGRHLGRGRLHGAGAGATVFALLSWPGGGAIRPLDRLQRASISPRIDPWPDLPVPRGRRTPRRPHRTRGRQLDRLVDRSPPSPSATSVGGFHAQDERSAQVVYPKDLGPILVYADIAPGLTVLEAGSGSGALTLGLSRAVSPTGMVVSVELREDHAHARKAVEKWYGRVPENVDLRVGDAAGVVESVRPPRIVLDLPEPWNVVASAAEHQPPGGCWPPTSQRLPQVQTTVEAARDTGVFTEIEVKEVLVRDWNVAGRSVRPRYQMIGHTGFLVFMRRLPPSWPKSGVERSQPSSKGVVTPTLFFVGVRWHHRAGRARVTTGELQGPIRILLNKATKARR